MFLLGAGVSVASGLPLFRAEGPKPTLCDGKKKVMQCEDAFKFPLTWGRYLSFITSADSWRQLICHYKAMAHLFLTAVDASPSVFHQMLAHLVERGKVRERGIVTTNIDGLELAAGIPEDYIVSVHGSVRKMRCIQCGEERLMTREIARRILDCDFSARPVDVVPVHDECDANAGRRVRVRRELLLFRPFVLLYNEGAWKHDVFPMYPLATYTRKNFALILAGASLIGHGAPNWVKTIQEKARTVIAVNTTTPKPVKHTKAFLLKGTTETVAAFTLPGHRPVRVSQPSHRNPCTLPVRVGDKVVTCPDPRVLDTLHQMAQVPEEGPSQPGTPDWPEQYYDAGPSRAGPSSGPRTRSISAEDFVSEEDPMSEEEGFGSPSSDPEWDRYLDYVGPSRRSPSYNRHFGESPSPRSSPFWDQFSLPSPAQQRRTSSISSGHARATTGSPEWSFDTHIQPFADQPVIDLTDDTHWGTSARPFEDNVIDLTDDSVGIR